MVHFDEVISEYLCLKPEFQNTIESITRKMGNGMAECIKKKIETEEDYNLYCHYVAGLVGIGLSHLFVQSKLEVPDIAKNEIQANYMGLFLQKTNIIRDFMEDFNQGRVFWPREIWSAYTENLSDFFKTPSIGVPCLNELILDALKCLPHSIEYLSMLKNPAVFNFCAIPQAMAISTLALCFNNPNLFQRNIKISRGTASRLMLYSNNMDQVKEIFLEFANAISRKIEPHEPQYMEAQLIVGRIKSLCIKRGVSHTIISNIRSLFWIVYLPVFCSLLVYLCWGYGFLKKFQ